MLLKRTSVLYRREGARYRRALIHWREKEIKCDRSKFKVQKYEIWNTRQKKFIVTNEYVFYLCKCF